VGSRYSEGKREIGKILASGNNVPKGIEANVKAFSQSVIYL
jgi:hypothetical protein